MKDPASSGVTTVGRDADRGRRARAHRRGLRPDAGRRSRAEHRDPGDAPGGDTENQGPGPAKPPQPEA